MPTLDCMPACTKELTRFEQRGIYVAKVRNASYLGSHSDISRIHPIRLISLRAFRRFSSALWISSSTPTWTRTLWWSRYELCFLSPFASGTRVQWAKCRHVPTSGWPTIHSLFVEEVDRERVKIGPVAPSFSAALMYFLGLSLRGV